MAVGRGRGDAGHTAGIGQREILRTALHDELACCGDQCLAQVAVMVRRLAHHLVSLGFHLICPALRHEPQHERFTRN